MRLALSAIALLGLVGVSPAQAVEFVLALRKLPGLHWRGITFYPGHIKDQNDPRVAELSATVATTIRLTIANT